MMDLVTNGHYINDSQSWLGAVDVGYLTEEERDQILAVLWRDEKIRKAEKSRVTKLKSELRDVKRKGAKNTESSYSSRVCARCNRSTGIIFNAPSQCPVCKHKVCKQCQITGFFSQSWKCVVCYKEAQLKAETGEWFYGMMKPELRAMQDGTTLVKQAVTTKSIHFDERSPSARTSPTNASAGEASKNDFISVSSADTEGTGSSTESRKHRDGKNRFGPAETGSISSLRTRTLSLTKTKSGSESHVSPHSSPSGSPSWRSKTLPIRSPQKPPRMIEVTDQALKQKNTKREHEIKSSAFHKEIDVDPPIQIPLTSHAIGQKQIADELTPEESDRPDGDQASLSSVDSKSIDIDRAVAEYVSQQEELEKEAQGKKGSEETSGSYINFENDLYATVNEPRTRNEFEDATEDKEAKDQVLQLPSPRQRTTLPRKLNQKLVEQNKFSQSVPNIGPAQTSQSKRGLSLRDAKRDTSDTASTFLNRELSSSIQDFMKSTTSLNSTSIHDLSISGEIRFFLKFNYKTNILLVNIVDCRNLAIADKKRGRSDPYVKCYLLPDRKNKQKTDVKKRTFAPVYNKCLKFTVSHSELSTRVLELSVWHAGTFTRNLFLGQVQVPLDTWDWESSNQNWYPLRQRANKGEGKTKKKSSLPGKKETISASFVRETIYKGDLIVGLKYTPSGTQSPGSRNPPHGELNVLIKQARNLTPVRSGGNVDAFVKIMLQPDKQFRQKTSVISKNASPEWNHNVRMQLYQPMEECGLQLSIWHREKIQGSTFLGGSRLNLGSQGDDSPKWMDAVGMEIGLWQAAINTPGTWVDGSLSLRPKI